jgi:hypothetical protein
LEDVDWVGRVFATVDAVDVEAFLSFLEEDAQSRFDSAPVVTGKEAIRDTIDGFFCEYQGSQARDAGHLVQGRDGYLPGAGHVHADRRELRDASFCQYLVDAERPDKRIPHLY